MKNYVINAIKANEDFGGSPMIKQDPLLEL